ncbi:response regulator [Paenibacillus sp. J5C_2022]|uniref:response regulator n=1 Tax=Paenibacillus sp. J5C2022 TaxID=2977129 RepID=UPI0021CECD0D|nr:response regulator [Paenibacillus sp. J5C2022]MCU6711040.1 response regulator [Paenibacillus sp. J5C2022]
MPKLMIVDDEETIRIGLASLIGRLLPEWEVALSCEDAASALAGLEKTRPDLAIIDINMPGMDGLTLAGELERLQPELYKIILTGHEKFTYLQSAMRQGVSDYLLKPVQRDELVQSVRKIEAVMAERERQTTVRLEKLLLEWMMTDSEHRFCELKTAWKQMQGKADATEYGVLVLFWEHGTNGLDRIHIEWVAKELKAFSRKIDQAIGTIVAESCALFVLRGDGLPSSQEWKGYLQELGKGCRESSPFPRIRAFGCSDSFRQLEGLRDAYNQAVNGMYERENGLPATPAPQHDWVKKLTLAIETNDSEETLQLLQDWKRELLQASERYPGRTTLLCFQFLAFLSGPALSVIPSKLGSSLLEQGLKLAQRLPLSLTPPVMLGEIAKFVDGLCFDDVQERNYRKVIVQVQQMIREEYADPDLNLETLAQRVYLHPSYLSELFKETTGQRFIDYVTEVRMEEARKILRETDKKMYEIAAAVGYTSPKYFSTLFRKRFRLTPMSYRERAQ